MRPVVRLAAFAVFSILAVPAFAGFQSTVEYLVAIGRVAGQGGAQFYTTIWATNLTGAPVSFKLDFLKQGQANPSPASFSDTLGAGQTRMYENVVETKLGLTSAIGAARITSTGKILVSERIYNQAPGADIGNTQGLFFAGVPGSFSISAGQSASIQGINQGGAENFRYNFAMIETGGGSPTANVQVFDANGTLLGQKAYKLLAYEQIQPGVADIVPSISTINARITATVTGGTGSLILAGAQLANVSQDSSGFEMSFRDDILGSGGETAGVASLNGLTGALTIAHGANTTVNVSGSTITIDAVATGGGGGGLSAVAHDYLLYGDGTTGMPLGVVVPGSWVASSNNDVLALTNEANGSGVYGSSHGGDGVHGDGQVGVHGISNSSRGVWGEGFFGVYGSGTGYGVYAQGSFGGTGAKYFVEPHPTDPGKEIRFVCLEGPESGTYFRGTNHIVGGFATIEIPESFRMVTAEKGLTVVVSPVGDPAMLYCVRRSLDEILIKGSADVEFDYVVNGVRKAFEDHEAISENKDFVPHSATDPHFTTGLPAESIRRLKANGILNSDGTIILETAHRLGWDQKESWKRAESDRVAATR